MTAGEHLTWNQICERHPERWVVLVDHDSLPHSIAEFRTARILAVGKTRVEAQERARPLLEAIHDWSCHFTGPRRGRGRGPAAGGG